MFIRIENSSGVPITRQIADQIRSHSAAGTLEPGDRLPSVRQLAKDLAVNQNTILRVYERLTSEGLLERKHGDGTYVADNLPRGRIKAQHDLLTQEADRLARHAADLGMTPAQLHELIDNSLTKTQKEHTSVKKGVAP